MKYIATVETPVLDYPSFFSQVVEEVEEQVPPWKKLLTVKKKPIFEQEPLPKEVLEKYTKGDGVNPKNLSKHASDAYQKKTATKEKKILWAEEVAARAELLLTEESG